MGGAAHFIVQSPAMDLGKSCGRGRLCDESSQYIQAVPGKFTAGSDWSSEESTIGFGSFNSMPLD